MKSYLRNFLPVYLQALLTLLPLTFAATEPTPTPSLIPSQQTMPIKEVSLSSIHPAEQIVSEADSFDAALIGTLNDLKFQNSATVRSSYWATALEQLQKRAKKENVYELRALLLSELASNRDQQISTDFEIGLGGRLANAPTYRVTLLDLLHEVNGQEVANIAESIFETTESGTERLLALSLIVKSDKKQGQEKGLQLLKNYLNTSAWERQPVNQFVEAFDLIVAAKDYEFIPQLLSLQSQELSVKHRWPAYLTIYRLFESDPVRAGEQVLSNFKKLDDFPELRADLFSMIAPSTRGKVNLLERYILRADIQPEESYKFFGSYLSNNTFYSDSLFTNEFEDSDIDEDGNVQPKLVDQDKLLQDLESAESLMNRWLADERFTSQHTLIAQTQERLSKTISGMKQGTVLYDTRY